MNHPCPCIFGSLLPEAMTVWHSNSPQTELRTHAWVLVTRLTGKWSICPYRICIDGGRTLSNPKPLKEKISQIGEGFKFRIAEKQQMSTMTLPTSMWLMVFSLSWKINEIRYQIEVRSDLQHSEGNTYANWFLVSNFATKKQTGTHLWPHLKWGNGIMISPYLSLLFCRTWSKKHSTLFKQPGIVGKNLFPLPLLFPNSSHSNLQ